VITGQAAIVIRDVTDPSPIAWTWGSGDIQYIDSICVGTDQPGNNFRYTVTATGSGAGGSFYLQGPQPASNDVLSYTVQWNNRANRTNGVTLTAGVPRNRRANPKLDLACNIVGVNATVIVTIPETDLLNAPAGNYSGTLYLEVAPR
jgi:hypothetical protein